jgi:hypothetical protein
MVSNNMTDMEFQEFYRQVMDIPARTFYKKVARILVREKRKIDAAYDKIPEILRSPDVVSHVRKRHERYQHHSIAPINAVKSLCSKDKEGYSVRDYALIGNEGDDFGVLFLQSTYEGLKELNIPLESLLK